MNKVDALIVGAGPAGIAAAIALARQQHSSIVFDDGVYRNDPADFMHLVPGFDHIPPSEFRKTAWSNMLSNYSHIQLEKAKISSAHKDAETGLFTVSSEAGKTWTGKKLIIASGVEDIPLPLDGYAECWGKAIFHCLFCKGYEQRGGASSGVLAIGGLSSPAMALHVARQASTLSRTVTIYTDGSDEAGAGITAGLGAAKVMNVDTRKIQRLVLLDGGAGGVRLDFADGSSAVERFLVHTPATRPRGPFAEQLGLQQMPSGDIKAGPPFYETSVKGVFAAGDSSGMMKNAPNAIFSGSLAGSGTSMQIVAEQLGQTSLF